MNELTLLRQLLRTLIRIIVDREAYWAKTLEDSQALLHVDELTGLYNYRYLQASLRKEIKRCLRNDSKFALLFIDIDDFKRINDHFGHLVGSSLLKQLGALLLATVRENDSVIRYGGDEFVILLTDTNQDSASLVAQRLRDTVDQFPFPANGKQLRISISIGIAIYPYHGLHANELLSQADQAMYQSKRNGKNKVFMKDNKSKFDFIKIG
ncbi:MAG: GGDEF domain-containing protein [Deltaproteobacteria bacterium]|nr:GGDEF domain-containing protein [Deltaproteobacteria bacterium]